MNANGSVIVGHGYYDIPNTYRNTEAFRWTANGGMVGLGRLPGAYMSEGRGVNADGSVVIGVSGEVYYDGLAFRWTQGTGMVSLGTLPGHTASTAAGVSGDGTIVVGNSGFRLNFREAFRWTAATGMVGLGALTPNGRSEARAISADGSTIIGVSGRGFRWTQATGMVSLDPVNAPSSTPNAVNADGSVIVGTVSETPSRWTSTTGWQSIATLLTAGGVDLTGWRLSDAIGVSADGTVITGTGYRFEKEAWVARIVSPYGPGLITPSAISTSFAGQSAIARTAGALIDGTLGTMTEHATQARASHANRTSPWSLFYSGRYDTDPTASGMMGATYDLANGIVIGGSLTANAVTTKMVYGGWATMTGGGASAFVAHAPEAGLQWLVGVSAMAMDGDIYRGYVNGSGFARSLGDSAASGYGITGRIGWSFLIPASRIKVTPFASYTASRVGVDGYTERTGPFPAQFQAFNDHDDIARFGADLRYSFAPGSWAWASLASAHRLGGSDTARISGRLLGLFGLSATGLPAASNWIEASAGLRLAAWTNGAVTASLTATIPSGHDTTYQARLGLVQTF